LGNPTEYKRRDHRAGDSNQSSQKHVEQQECRLAKISLAIACRRISRITIVRWPTTIGSVPAFDLSAHIKRPADNDTRARYQGRARALAFHSRFCSIEHNREVFCADFASHHALPDRATFIHRHSSPFGSPADTPPSDLHAVCARGNSDEVEDKLLSVDVEAERPSGTWQLWWLGGAGRGTRSLVAVKVLPCHLLEKKTQPPEPNRIQPGAIRSSVPAGSPQGLLRSSPLSKPPAYQAARAVLRSEYIALDLIGSAQHAQAWSYKPKL
jgi:hypothetical protein